MPKPVHPTADNRRSGQAVSRDGSGPLLIGNQTAFSAARFMEPFQYALANGFAAFEWFPDKKPDGAG